jgi:lipopolysaccharide biosynthesis glycosyltransferase
LINGRQIVGNQRKSTQTTGIIYIATGKKYIRMAMQSAKSVRKHNPEINIHLFGDWKEQGFDFEISCAPFSSVERVDDANYRSKVDYMGRTPYDLTLYLDTDTRVITDISNLFQILDRFDIALAYAPERVRHQMGWKIEIPECFPQFNSGVILFTKSSLVLKLLHDWKEAFHEARIRSDQVTLREVLWCSDLRIATLPPEYNLRYFKYILFWNKREAKPKILHLHYYRRGIFWLFYPWFISAIFLFRKITKTSGLSHKV